MEKVGRPANLSLRYGLSLRSFESEASSSAMEQRSASVRNSDNDVDFDDVFGGPPTRTRYSFSGSRIKSSDESTSSLSGLGERPVFGESYSSPRKRTSDDFYDDIFRRSDESVRSPRWCSHTPGSRTLSPAHPRIEPYATSVPAEFSLPAKMTKVVDIPVFGSNVHTPSTPLSRFSSSSTQGREVFRGQSPGQMMLSRESSSVKESLFSTQSTENEIDHKSKNRTTRTGSPSSEFHFSIHKWANVGVPLLMSIRGGIHPTLKGSSKVSAVQDSGFPDEDLSAEKEDKKPVSGISLMEAIEKETSTVAQEFNMPEVMPPSSLLHDEIERKGYEAAGKEAEAKENMEKMNGKKKPEAKKMNFSKKAEANKHVVGSPKSSPKSRVKGMVKDFFKMSNQDSPPKTKTNVSSRWKTGGKNRTQEEVTDIMSNLDINGDMKPDASKTTKSVSGLLKEDVKKAPDASKTTKSASELPKENAKKRPDSSKTTKMASESPTENVKIGPDASKTTKMANELRKENAKIALDTSKTTKMASTLSKENMKIAPDASKTTKLDSQVPADNVNMMQDASFMVKEQIGKSNKLKFPSNRTIRKLEDINFQTVASAASESVPYTSKPSVENIDDPSLDNFQVEELTLVDDDLSKTREESDPIMALDSKIHLWSTGRKGNIRSLLSTLQLVLWADSGWKPVALVDIIEANAVKKAYNRAMLCLHPDKLQQKGADSNKKYTAEKVFDILQEAWDHFNSLGTLV